MNLASVSAVFAISSYVLLTLTFALTLKYFIFFDKSENKNVLKLIGGLVAFEVALVSQNLFIIFSSLFIGGLIIASESFMRNLAIILKSKSEDIGKNLMATSATKEEVREKREEEKIELEKVSKIPNKKIFLEKKKKYEQLVILYFKSKFSRFEENVRISSSMNKETIVDGLIRWPNEEIMALIEVKYIRNTKASQKLLENSLYRIRKIATDKLLFVTLVSDNRFTKNQIINILSLQSTFPYTQFFFFEIENEKLKAVYEPNMLDE